MSAEEELRALVDERVRAVADRDEATLSARFADDLVSFDVLPPLRHRGSGPVVDHLRQWFAGYDSPIDYSVRDVETRTDGDLGVVWFLYHVGGTLSTGAAVDMWVRATVVCHRTDGRWQIVHDHESVPFDPETGQALIGLAPE